MNSAGNDRKSPVAKRTPTRRLALNLVITAGALHAVAVGMLGIANAVGPDRWWWSGMNMYLPQWLWLIPSVALIPLFLWLVRRWSWVPILCAVWVAGPQMGYCWGGSRPDAGKRIRVMTWNIQSWKSADSPGIADGIARYEPDILLLQDARGAIDGPLKDVLKPFKVASFGQYVIASKYPIVEQTVGDISYRGEKHTYLRAALDVDNHRITVCTAHFTTPRDGIASLRHFGLDGIRAFKRNLEDRITQAESLARDLRGVANPLIVGGDLNAPIQSQACRALLNLGLADTFGSTSRGYGYTYGHTHRIGKSFVRIDHILAGGGLSPVSSFVGDIEASDHRPVISDLALARD